MLCLLLVEIEQDQPAKAALTLVEQINIYGLAYYNIMAPIPKFGKKSKQNKETAETDVFESQLKAKDLELKECRKRIAELEEQNEELRLLLKQAKPDSTAVFIRSDGGENFKQTQTSIMNETGTVTVTSPTTSTVKALSRIRSLGRGKSSDSEKNNELIDFEFEHQEHPQRYHLANDDRNLNEELDINSQNEASNEFNANGNTAETENEEKDKINMGNRTFQRLKSAKASVRQSFGKSKTRNEFEFEPVPDAISVNQPDFANMNMNSAELQLHNEMIQSQEQQRSTNPFDNPFDFMQTTENDKNSNSNLSAANSNNEDGNDMSKTKNNKGVMSFKQMRPSMSFRNKKAGKGFNPFAEPGDEESRERAQTLGIGMDENQDDSINNDDRTEESGIDKRRRSMSLRSFKKKDQVENFDSTPFNVDD